MKRNQGFKKLLALCLVLSMILSMSLTAFASSTNEETVIEQASLTGVPAQEDLVVGQNVPTLNIQAPADANYTVIAYWINDKTSESNYSGVVEDKNSYQLYIEVNVKDGYEFSHESALTLDGEETNAFYTWDEHNRITKLYTYVRYSFLTVLDHITIEISSLPTAAIGGQASTTGVEVSAGNWELDWAGWYDYTTNALLQDGDVFVKGHEYTFEQHIKPSEGYEFGENVTVMVDGIQEPSFYLSYDSIRVFRNYSFMEKIEKIEVTDIPKAEIGKTASLNSIKVPEDANYKIDQENTKWYDIVEGEREELGEEDVFQNGHKYVLELYIISETGYEFVEEHDAEITLNNGELEADYQHCYSNEANFEFEYSFFSELPDETLEVTATEPEVGKTVASANVKVPENANYKVDYADWIDVTDGWTPMGENDTFQDGHRYRLNVSLQLEHGYEFKEDLTIKVNGEEADYYYNGEDYASFYEDFTFCKQIETIEVTGVTIPEIGKAVDYTTIKVADDANYVLREAEWYDVLDGSSLDDGATFQDGHKYSLYIKIIPIGVYEFTEDTILLVNGQKLDYSECPMDYTYAEIHKEYSFMKQIQKIEIQGALPEAVAGETASAPTLRVPENANYTVSAKWQEFDGYWGWNSFEGKFAEENVYRLSVRVVPNDGYEFADDAVVTVAGKPMESIFCDNQNQYYDFDQVYDLGENTIDVVAITVTEPKAGDKITSPKVQISGNANYEVWWAQWYDAETPKIAKGTFEEGKKYELYVNLEALDGYIFSDNLKIKVNGKEIDIKQLSKESYFETSYIDIGVLYDLTVADNNQNNSNQNTTTTPSPATGDSTNMILWIALAVIAMAGMAVVVSKKRYEV